MYSPAVTRAPLVMNSRLALHPPVREQLFATGAVRAAVPARGLSSPEEARRPAAPHRARGAGPGKRTAATMQRLQPTQQ
jgi:hypothetical protein